jgi:glycerol-3-phosphate acyltransferase PlsY
MAVAAVLLLGYLLGAIPFGLLVARACAGVDVRRVGSGNIGATNVLRAAGKGAAAAALALDLAKGWAAVGAARWLGLGEAAAAAAGGAAVAGHVFPVFLRFRGGKGVATSLGALAGLAPRVAAATGAAWVGMALGFRYSSLASLTALGLSPAFAWGLDGRATLIGLAAGLALLMVATHRGNLRRLWAGREPRLGEPVAAAPAGPGERPRGGAGGPGGPAGEAGWR